MAITITQYDIPSIGEPFDVTMSENSTVTGAGAADDGGLAFFAYGGPDPTYPPPYVAPPNIRRFVVHVVGDELELLAGGGPNESTCRFVAVFRAEVESVGTWCHLFEVLG
jgi:hypothetical protein